MKSSISKEISDCKTELSDIQSIINEQGSFHNTTPYLIRYSVVRACGNIEVCYKEIICGYFCKTRLTQIHTYLEKTIRFSPASPLYDNVCNTLKKFDDKWNNTFKIKLRQNPKCNQIIASLKSLVNARNQYAHGHISLVTTMNQVVGYYNDSVEMLEILDETIYSK